MPERIVNMSDSREAAQFLNELRRLKGPHRFDWRRFRPRRSDRQNAYFHPCFCQPFADFLTDQGQPTTMLEAKELLKYKFLRRTKADPLTGEMIEYVGRTRDLDVAEFNELLDQCDAWLSGFGIRIPDPADYHVKD
jgi:hypothetical protein